MITNNNFDDQKHCSCKKSRCLKLYCDCFSAGLYCGEACSCQECFNSLDYEDTVDETRQQIELRNPQAFSPKIHNVEDRDHPMPIAGKHKKGCNCKKSMCMKRYCECYQANVGCSGECRCEGCKNVFGKKGEYNVCNESTPSTPWAPLQHSGHEKSAAVLFNGCYIPSPGYANCDMISGTSNENFDMVSSDQQSYPYVEPVNQFTPPDTMYINARHPAFMSNLPPTTDWPNISRANENLSPVISWSGSLVTPVSLFGGPKVNDSNEKPIGNIDKSTPSAQISTNSQAHHNTGSMTSDQ